MSWNWCSSTASQISVSSWCGTAAPVSTAAIAHRCSTVRSRASLRRLPCFIASCEVKVPRCSSRYSSPAHTGAPPLRSEEHTSELQSRGHLVCRLLLEKKKTHKQH